MRITKFFVGGLAVILAVSVAAAQGQRKIAVLDNCDPDDPAWAPTGGCTLKEGDVTNAEFNALLTSPLSLSTVGHPSWRNEPSYLTVRSGKDVRVTNEGGRGHTFTEVAEFGGGRVPPLNVGLTPAPECATSPMLAPGASIDVTGLSVGLHRFQCCIHPWMRAAIRVEP
jgi:plastocyanin